MQTKIEKEKEEKSFYILNQVFKLVFPQKENTRI